MGNSNKIQGNSNLEQTELKNLVAQSDNLAAQLDLDSYSTSILRRIFVQRKQKHLIKVIKSYHKQKLTLKMHKFIDQINEANLELLDSFYQHIVLELKAKEQMTIISPFDRQMGICGATSIMTSHKWQPLTEKHINIIDLTQEVQKIERYEMYKQKGLSAIIKEQVCFILLAGGKNTRYDLKCYKQCDPLTLLPSNSSLIQLIFSKLEALGKLIDTKIYLSIMTNDQDHKQKIKQVTQFQKKFKYLDLTFLTQLSYGCLDSQGKVVLTDEDEVYMHPNGCGDLWANFQEQSENLYRLSQFKYIQIFGTSNLLETCFDCFMIGKVIQDSLPWITMAKFNDSVSQQVNPVIILDEMKRVITKEPQQFGENTQFFRNCPHNFLNNSVFSTNFIKRAVMDKNWQGIRKYHCKKKNVSNKAPLSRYYQIFTFEREISDIFTITSMIQHEKKGTVVFMDEKDYYSRFYTKEDKVRGIINLSNKFKRWIKIDRRKMSLSPKKKNSLIEDDEPLEVCEISPFVSLEGEDLQGVIQDIRKVSHIQYPFYLGIEESPQF